jgi:DNA-directed RNA polymerase subunit M/transcription elongation factor TFIIS
MKKTTRSSQHREENEFKKSVKRNRELEGEIKKLKKEVSRLRKELSKKIEIEEDLIEEPQQPEPAKTTSKSCPNCGSEDLSSLEMKFANKKLEVCKKCYYKWSTNNEPSSISK